jgi:hypothetical protein
MPRIRTLGLLATAGAALLAVSQVAQAQRSGTGPCRNGVLALIAMIDAGEQSTPEYRHAATAVVETCGPAAKKGHAQAPAAFDKAACAKLALAMLDAIEDNKIGKGAFVQPRDAFARTCMAP